MLDIYKTLISGILEKAKTFKGDWNENDSSSPNYIKNKTHWIEKSEKTLIDTTIPVEDFDEYGEIFYAPIQKRIILVPGETYYVTFNNEEYECVAWANSEINDGVFIGNGSIYGREGMGGNEPFTCDSYPDGSIYLNIRERKECKIKIAEKTKIVHKLDKEFLPDDALITIDEDRLETIANSIFEIEKYTIEYLDYNSAITSMTYENIEIIEGKAYENEITFCEYGIQILVYMNDVFKQDIRTGDLSKATIFIPEVTGNLRIEIRIMPR